MPATHPLISNLPAFLATDSWISFSVSRHWLILAATLLSKYSSAFLATDSYLLLIWLFMPSKFLSNLIAILVKCDVLSIYFISIYLPLIDLSTNWDIVTDSFFFLFYFMYFSFKFSLISRWSSGPFMPCQISRSIFM